MKTQVLVAAAGKGTRLKARSPKPLIVINNKPLLVYSLEVFEKCSLVDSVIVVAPKDSLKSFEKIIKNFHSKKKICCVAGGKRRCDSVARGLKRLDKDTQLVVVHDGARPFLTVKLLKECIWAAQKNRAAIAGVPVKPTVKRVHPRSLKVQQTLRRDELWEIQTPQAFDKDILLEAYKHLAAQTPTDDAQLVERLGVKPKIVHGSY
ncbi:MAG: 2-C-methyl-D-erythritol 4-phosphate cytidylyltransferase, partial [Candidatus Omnitrophota bacterium]